jgi:6-phosphogluconate dehydrogenase (decarboxylating)/glucose-6-phosphate 1-dehydrogenase
MKTNVSHNIPTILVIFGMTGDLAEKKIIPSLWRLFQQGSFPDRLSVIGFSRRILSRGAFETLVQEAVLRRGGADMPEKEFSDFFEKFSYQQGTFEDAESFRALRGAIADIETSWGVCANKLFYFAVPPSSYEVIFKNLAAVQLNLPCGGDLGWTPLEAAKKNGMMHKHNLEHEQHLPLTGWSRVLIEKPFGSDLASAQKLQALVSSYFTEEQVYRIDHYLFKEIVQGIENFRFSNNLFEHTWDNTTIERIDIRLHEVIGAEDRGSFYDAVGALRDVGQNHLLAMLSAITMEYPFRMGEDAIRKNRARILETLAPWIDDSMRSNTFRAQYDGYQSIRGVRPDSDTETYFALKTELLHHRWKGIPIYMEAGKRMAEARKEIVLTLKHPSLCLLCETGLHAPNRIVFRLEPNDEIVIHFWTKKPGFERVLEERIFSFFLYEKETKAQYVAEYAKVLYAAMGGDQAFFIASEEIEALWKFIDPIVAGWKRNVVPLLPYAPHTTPKPVLLAPAVDEQDNNGQSVDREIGIIGLGKMGANMSRRLISKKWRVVGFNKDFGATKELEREGLVGTGSLREFACAVSAPRVLWLMAPHGAVDGILKELISFLEAGDTVIDGGNSPYQESIRRGKELAELGIHFLDVGVSGGPGGAREGASLMIGGDKEIFEKFEPLFRDVAARNGYQFFEGAGMGHFVKMIHNGIEYGMMQSLAEGFAVMRAYAPRLDLARVADAYNHRSVIESRLVGWLKDAFEKYGQDLHDVSGSVSHTGEGEWTIQAAEELKVPTPVIRDAFDFRVASARTPSYAGKIISALRNQFGGHSISPDKK